MSTILALVQDEPGADLETSVGQALARMDQAAEHGARIIAFPEVHLTPFFPQFPGGDASRHLISLEHPIVNAFRDRCRGLGVVAIPNIYLDEGGRRFDASVVIGPTGEILGVSKMVHVVQAPGFYEQDYYEPSDGGFQVYATPFGTLGIVVCFDRHFPESIRTSVLGGARLIIVPTVNTKTEDLELFEWELRVSAYQNGVFIAMCNRVGREAEMDFGGESIIVGPTGERIAKADDRAGILFAELDWAEIDAARASRPFLELRRPATYAS